MKLSIKIFFGIFLTVLTAVLISYGIFRYAASKHFNKVLIERLKQIGATVDYEIYPYIVKENYKELNSTVIKLGKVSNARITVIRRDGKVLADSKENPQLMENHINRPEVITAINGKLGTSVRYSATLRKNMLYVALPIKQAGKISYILRTSMFSHDVNTLLAKFFKTMTFPIMLILFIAAIISIIIAGTVSKPIKKLTLAARAVAKGDFSHKIPIEGSGEIAELTVHFNEMIKYLSEYILEISAQKDTLNAIVTNINEGVIAFELDGRIQLFNNAFLELVERKIISGKFYWETFREPELLNLIEYVISNKNKCKIQIEINNKHLLCTGNISKAGNHIIVSVFDITEILELSKVKKDFVTNASHELKTPLTSINGYLDLAIDSCKCEARQYLEIVKRNTKRLINIVKDLLTLADLEKSQIKIDKHKIDLNQLVKNVAVLLEAKAREKNLFLKINIPEEKIYIIGDEFKIEQLFVNLIDNAIKYTESGGVTITLKKKNNNIIISVADTGIGIPKKDVNRIFERFYVVDKARSRKSGGTGLGLSIVKHIAMIHNGKLRVKSVPGKGSEFIVVFDSLD